MTEIEFGEPIPENLEYAVSFSIPTWDLALGCAKRDPKLMGKMTRGYPRFFPQPSVQLLSTYFLANFGVDSESCRLFPSLNVALNCLEFLKSVIGPESTAHLGFKNFVFEEKRKAKGEQPRDFVIPIAAVLASGAEFEIVKDYWKLRGEIISSRLAAFINRYLETSVLKGHSIRAKLVDSLFIAKKKGHDAKALMRIRIANSYSEHFSLEELIVNPNKDVFLVSSGMSTIHTAREILTFWEHKRISNYDSNEIEPDKKDTLVCETVAVFGFLFKNT